MPIDMIKNIESLSDLRLEIERISSKRDLHERQLSEQVKAYANSMRPANLIKNALTGMGQDKELTGMLKTKGVEAAIGLVITQLLFKNSNPLIKTAASLFGTSFATGVFGEDASQYVDKIKKIFQKFTAGKESPGNGVFRDEDIYKV